MTDKPILFSVPMVRALLAGTKTQTRRELKPQPYDFVTEGKRYWNASGVVGGRICICDRDLLNLHHKPHAGDRLWVREAWRVWWEYNDFAPSTIPTGADVQYAADNPLSPWDTRSRSSIHMPRWASRLTLIVDAVKVERLQDISEVDAIAEGVECDSDGWVDYLMPSTQCCASAIDSYRTLWSAINGPGSWEANPWVVAYTFRVIKANIDASPHDSFAGATA